MQLQLHAFALILQFSIISYCTDTFAELVVIENIEFVVGISFRRYHYFRFWQPRGYFQLSVTADSVFELSMVAKHRFAVGISMLSVIVLRPAGYWTSMC